MDESEKKIGEDLKERKRKQKEYLKWWSSKKT
jgi:hypothetical protein